MRRLLLIFLVSFAVSPLFARERIKVACVGNSVTYGYGLENRETESYPSRLQALLGEEYDVRNFGHSGATLLRRAYRPYTEQQAYRDALDFAADIVVIHLGLNDTDPRAWPNYRDVFVADYLDLIEDFRKVNPECKVWVCRMTPISHRHHRFKSGTRDWYWMEQERIELVAKVAGTGLIDLQKSLYSRPDLLPDSLHPNAEGACIMARTVYSALTGDFGGLRMPEIYSDGMVLQRGRPLEIMGTADAGEKVTVRLAGQKKSAVAASDGHWSICLDPLAAAKGLTLNISTPKRNLRYKDVAAGEVWVCSGQSNMAFKTMSMVSEERSEVLETVDRQGDNVRLFNMRARWSTDNRVWDKAVYDSLNRLRFFHPAVWEYGSRESADSFSAIGLAFGQMLADSLNVPIGLVLNAVGGAATESWIDRKTLEFEFPDIMIDWRRNDFVMPWVREIASVNIKDAENPHQRHPFHPCYLFEAGIEPLEHYQVRGTIWYQGESNGHNVEVHERLFPLLVQSWRSYWNDPDMPFLFVQLSSLNRPSWTWFRDSQRRLAEAIPACAMAVSSDRGDSLDVHPRRKLDVGRRLGVQALYNVYGDRDVVPSGPVIRSARLDGNDVVLAFDWADGLRSADGDRLRTFELAGEDEQFRPAEAIVEGSAVRLRSDAVPSIKWVRYGWQPFTRANLVNSAFLPASTFRLAVE